MNDKFQNKRLRDMTYDELLEYEEYLKNKGCDPGPKGKVGYKVSFKEKACKRMKTIINKIWR